MCCITIETDVLMANFFGSDGYKDAIGEKGANIEELEKCATILANNLPGYVFCDLSSDKVDEVIKKNRDYLKENNRIFYRGEGIDLTWYNAIYPSAVSDMIISIIRQFFKRGLYNRTIDRVAIIRA